MLLTLLFVTRLASRTMKVSPNAIVSHLIDRLIRTDLDSLADPPERFFSREE